MRILALDAALGPCSAALVADGALVAQHVSHDARGASAALPGLVAAVLAGRGFDAVVVTVGPGSFTGIRAALALGHGLAIGAGVPIFGVTSMAAIEAAWAPVPGAVLWIAIDTRRGRVFLGRGGGDRRHGAGRAAAGAGGPDAGRGTPQPPWRRSAAAG